MRKKMKIFICNNQSILTQIFEKLKAVWLGNVCASSTVWAINLLWDGLKWVPHISVASASNKNQGLS